MNDQHIQLKYSKATNIHTQPQSQTDSISKCKYQMHKLNKVRSDIKIYLPILQHIITKIP